MVNIFSLILTIATFITGFIWCIDRFKLARSGNEIVFKNTHNWYWIEIFASIFPMLLLVFLMRSFVFEPYQIPSGSMMPSLLVGDFILVKKFAYGIKEPITQTTLIKTGHPKRGDVVVFKYPLNPGLDYIKRVVGLPGDRVIYDPVNKQVKLQPSCTNGKSCAMELPIIYSDLAPSNFIQIFNLTEKGQDRSFFLQVPPDSQVNDGIPLLQRKESLDGAVHNVLTVPGQHEPLRIYYRQPGSPLAEWVVPNGEYFMMGDNRDNSADSRYWGFVPEKNLVGKAMAIWISIDKQKGFFSTSIRLSRIGYIH
ncbi:MAG: signal peptidase I [Sodalis sp. (in: enterobacteria)]